MRAIWFEGAHDAIWEIRNFTASNWAGCNRGSSGGDAVDDADQFSRVPCIESAVVCAIIETGMRRACVCVSHRKHRTITSSSSSLSPWSPRSPTSCTWRELAAHSLCGCTHIGVALACAISAGACMRIMTLPRERVCACVRLFTTIIAPDRGASGGGCSVAIGRAPGARPYFTRFD